MDVILKTARALRNASANLSTSLKRYFKETVLLKENVELYVKTNTQSKGKTVQPDLILLSYLKTIHLRNLLTHTLLFWHFLKN